jgi:energy-coupling factor transporter transmembrane protein EcfT
MEDLRHLEFFAVNSKEIVEKQVDSYRQQHSYAGTIIGVTALFIPFFLSSLVGTFIVIQLISVIPIALFIWAILLMLNIFKTKPLDQAYNVGKYHELLTKTYKEILLSEIEANTNSYSKNKIITEKGNKDYTTAVRLTTIALLVSIVLLFTNQFFKIEKVPTKVQVVNIKKTPINNSINDSTKLHVTSPNTLRPH